MFADQPAAGYDESEHEKAEHYRLALKNSPVVFARIDAALRYEWIYNPHPDFDPAAVVGKRDDELDSGPGIDAMVALKRRALAEGVQLRQEISFDRSDGVHTYDITATPIQDASGQFTHLITASIDITGRVRAEAALLESERKQRELIQSLAAERNRLAAVLENLPVGVWIADQDGQVIAKNPESDRIWHGDSPLLSSLAEYTEYIAWDAHTGQRLRPEDYPLAKALQTGTPAGPMELRIRRFDGSEGTVLVSAAPLYDAAGKAAGGVGINVDISARKQAEDALREREAALKRSQAVAHVGHWTWNVSSSRITWSEEMKYIIGLDPDAFGGDLEQIVDRAIHRDDAARMRAHAAAVIRERQPANAEFRVVWPDGSVHYVQAIAGETIFDAQGSVVQLSGVVQDITDRKLRDLEREQLLGQLQDRAEQLLQVMRSVPEGVLLLDNLGYVLLANPHAEEMLVRLAAYDPDHAAAPDSGRRLLKLGGVPLEQLLTSPPVGQRHTIEAERQIVELTVRPVEAGPVPAGWVLVLRDVTAERAVQEQLRRQERLAAVGQLAAGIAHDFNNIMSVISIYAELIIEAPGLMDKERARTMTIIEQAQRAARMIRQILDFSRQAVYERNTMDLLPLLKEEEKLLRQTLPENIEIELAVVRGEYLVKADPTRLQQLVMNLAVNSRDAMPEGGRLRIELARLQVDESSQVPILGMELGEWILLSVGDTGSGIAPEHMAQIFEPFFTTKEPGKGAGLGLAQVHGIVAQHEGYITAASEAGAGTVFTIYLPAQEVDAGERAARPAPLPSVQGHGELVLVVEDDAALRGSLVELLDMWNYRVVEAANGAEAIASLAQSGEVDVIVSDVVMPRLGGIGLVQALRRDGVATPVILMSGYMPDADRQGLKGAGVVAWLDKPPGSAALAAALAAAVGRT